MRGSPELQEVDTSRRFRLLLVAAATLAVSFGIPHLTLGRMASDYRKMYAALGGQVPALSSWVLHAAESPAFTVALIACDIAVFWLMYRLARRYWTGLLFAPCVFYALMSLTIAWLYRMPMQGIAALVQ